MSLPHHGCMISAGLLMFFTGIAGISTGCAEPVGNGNELALGYATNSLAGRQLIQKNTTGSLLTFRYLKITAIKADTPLPGATTLITVEPSSNMKIALVIAAPVSLEIAKTLAVDDCVAANGRVKSIGQDAEDLLILDPAVLKHKDRGSPKQKKELLHEVDASAH